MYGKSKTSSFWCSFSKKKLDYDLILVAYVQNSGFLYGKRMIQINSNP